MGVTAAEYTQVGIERTRMAPHRGVVADEYMFVLGREERALKLETKSTTFSDRVVRRPLGQEFKADTYSYIEVLRQEDGPDGSVALVPIAIFNENHYTVENVTEDPGFNPDVTFTNEARSNPGIVGAVAPYANNFLIQQTNEVREEKFQLLETFGDNFAFFFGERPRFFDVTGILLNSNSHRWKREWWLNYENYLRGTKAVENKSLVTLHVDNVAISGYLLTSSAAEMSNNPRQLQFTFRMLITDYVFEDAPLNTLNYFAENLLANRDPEETGDQPSTLTSFGDKVDAGFNFVDKYLNNSVTKAAVSIITQSVFGNPLGAVTSGIASSVAVFERLTGNANLSEFDFFRQGAGSFVEYQGKPPGMYPVNKKGDTLQQAGVTNLLASIDNSLDILLNLQTSPVVQSVAAIGSLIEGAVQSLSASQVGFAANSKEKYNEFLGRSGKNTAGGPALISGRYMGFDFIMPFKGLQISTVNPASERVNTADIQALQSGVEDRVATGEFGDLQFHTFDVFTPVSGSDVDFDMLKKDPNYELLPRSWRIRIEKDPVTMSRKVMSSSRRNGDDDLKLVLRRTTDTTRKGSTLLTKIEQELGV